MVIKYCPFCGLRLVMPSEEDNGWVECLNCGSYFIKVIK